MAALTEDRKAFQYAGNEIELVANEVIYAGAMIQVTSAGKAANATNAGEAVIGVAAHGAKADAAVRILKSGVFGFVNDSGDGKIALANIGDACYALDNQTVTLTANNATVGTVFGFDGDTVLVKI